MFNQEELNLKLNHNKTQLTLIIPAKDSSQATCANFQLLADFINQTPDCQQLRFLCQFEMSREAWKAFGECIATTQLTVLDVSNNHLGKMPDDILPNWRIRDLMQALQNNRTLYYLNARDSGLDRICVTQIKQDILQRPLWISMQMTQNQLEPPTCSCVDEGVADNRERAVQFAISMAQAAVTQHVVNGEVGKYRDCMRGIFTLPKDVITHLNRFVFFSKENHPLNSRIARYFPKAYAIAQKHPQTRAIENKPVPKPEPEKSSGWGSYLATLFSHSW